MNRPAKVSDLVQYLLTIPADTAIVCAEGLSHQYERFTDFVETEFDDQYPSQPFSNIEIIDGTVYFGLT